MGHNQRNEEIRDNVERMRRDALATVEHFNARLPANRDAPIRNFP